MKLRIRQLTLLPFAPALLASLLLLLFTSCATTPYYAGLQERIPDDANIIILIQEEAPPAEVYVDAIHSFERSGYEIVASEETMEINSLTDLFDQDGALTFSATKQVDADMALRITGRADVAKEGGRLIASAEYATTMNTPLSEWNDARWTNDRPREAFFTALEQLRHTGYDALDFEIRVGIAQAQ